MSPVFLFLSLHVFIQEPRDYMLKAFCDITPLPSLFYVPASLPLSLGWGFVLRAVDGRWWFAVNQHKLKIQHAAAPQTYMHTHTFLL